MSQLLQAAVLGLIQGITEFLPISSSGHLLLAREVLGWQLLADPHLNKMFDVALHAGTLLSLLLYFRAEVARLLAAMGQSLARGIGSDPHRRLGWVIALGALPGALAGLLGEEIVEQVLGAPLLVATQIFLFALLLYAADRWGQRARGLEAVGWREGLAIGLAQALALAPGVSRSGITITAGLALGLRREAAARFSFLLSLPIIAGAACYGLAEVTSAAGRHALPGGAAAIFLVGMGAAALSGYLCIRYFLRYLQHSSLTPFVLYRVALAAVLVGWLTLR